MAEYSGQAAPAENPGIIARLLSLYTALAAVRVNLGAQAASSATSKILEGADWRDEDTVTEWASEVATITAPIWRAMADATRATNRKALSELTGKSLDPARRIATDQLRGVPDAVLWGRMADYYRYEISTGATPERAQALVVQRAEIVADTQTTLAMRNQAGDDLAKQKDVIGWRRVIHPELSESGASCGLCIVASDRWYSRGDLMPIHARCNCLPMPITREHDPGFRINQDDLNTLYAAAGSNTARDLKATRFAVKQHGELGPVLVKVGTTDKGQVKTAPVAEARVGKQRTADLGFRTIKDYAKTQSVSPKIRAQQQLPAMIESLARLEARKADGDSAVNAPIAFHRKRITELRRLAAG